MATRARIKNFRCLTRPLPRGGAANYILKVGLTNGASHIIAIGIFGRQVTSVLL